MLVKTNFFFSFIFLLLVESSSFCMNEKKAGFVFGGYLNCKEKYPKVISLQVTDAMSDYPPNLPRPEIVVEAIDEEAF